MWGATAERAVVEIGGQEEARAARAPHTDKTASCFNVGRDRRARGRSCRTTSHCEVPEPRLGRGEGAAAIPRTTGWPPWAALTRRDPFG